VASDLTGSASLLALRIKKVILLKIIQVVPKTDRFCGFLDL